MGRLEELRINAYLSEVARGYSNNAFVAQNLFPTIYSEKEKIDIFEFNKEAFNIYDTERAIRANSNVISPQGFKKHTTTLTEHDLSYPIDYREEQEAEKIKLQLHATNVVTNGLQLKHEKQCADLVQDPNNYSNTNKILLSGTSCFNYKISDPQGVIDDAKDKVSAKIAQDPNTMVIGQEAWKSLKKHPQLKGLISSNLNKLVTIELLKEIFEIENIVIGKSIFADKDGNFVRIWKDSIILAYVPNLGTSRTEYDPSFAYTVRKKDALQIDEYTKEGNKVKYIRATDIYTPFLVGAEAGYLIGNVNDPNYDKNLDVEPEKDGGNNG
ncbi:hypothetical protein J6I39_06805 [bacterium]|nr:hypothetical protein [bacterium]